MTNFNVDYKVQFHREFWDNYHTSEATSYTTVVDVFGIGRTFDNSSTHKLGYNLKTNYTINGTITFTTDKPIKYIHTTFSLCNRVYDVFETIGSAYIGPFNKNGELEIKEYYKGDEVGCIMCSERNLLKEFQELSDEGYCNNEIPCVKLDAIVCDFMDGTREVFTFDMCVKTEELEVITPKIRKKIERKNAEPSKAMIFLINLWLTPIGGILLSLWEMKRGSKKAGKYYLKFSLSFLVIGTILLFLWLIFIV